MGKKTWMIVLMVTALLPRLLSLWQAPRERRECRANLRRIGIALEMYASDHAGRYPPTLRQLVGRPELPQMPTCPAAGFDNYSSTYHCTAQPDAYSFGCRGRIHGDPPGDDSDESWHERVLSSRQGYPWEDSQICFGCMDHP